MDFESADLGDPVITFKENEEEVSVTLICTVDILNGIEMWKNVTYRIEWFSEGNSLKEETICGGLPPGGTNTNSCPGGELVSRLPGTSYQIGQWV